jgi:dTDP-4-amino-4,6-dideoxygalactose transaminase
MSEEIENAVVEAVRQYVAGTTSSAALGQIHLCGTGAVAELEDKLKRHYGMRHALCVSNGSTGLLAIALALGLEDAEFVTTPYTYGATVAGWLLLGNKPVFADIDPYTLTLDPEAVRCTIRPKTQAILAVDIYGVPADQVALRRVADEHGLWYIADAAQSLGAVRDGLPASALADALVVSFTTGKSVFAGEGGAVLTNNTDLYEKLLWYTQHPARQRRELGLHLSNEVALNSRIHPLAAIWASAAFEESLRKLRCHQRECFKLIDVLNALGWTEPIEFTSRGLHPTFFRLTAAWKDQPAESDLLQELRNRGIRVSLASPPVRLLYQQPAFLARYRRRFRMPAPCHQAEHQARQRFCLVKEAGH